MDKKTERKPKKPEPPAEQPAPAPATTQQERAAEACPYCESKDFVKRGVRENKHPERLSLAIRWQG